MASFPFQTVRIQNADGDAGGAGLTSAARCWNGSSCSSSGWAGPEPALGPQMMGAGRFWNRQVFFQGVEHCRAAQLSLSACQEKASGISVMGQEVSRADISSPLGEISWEGRFWLSMLREYKESGSLGLRAFAGFPFGAGRAT